MWEQNNSRLQIKPTDKSSTTLAEVKSLVLLPKSWHQNSTKNFTSDRLKPAEMCGRTGTCSLLVGNIYVWLKPEMGVRGVSLTMQDLLQMVFRATVVLLGLKLCSRRGLLPLAALPLTQGCHVEMLPAERTHRGRGSDYPHWYTCTHRQRANMCPNITALRAKANRSFIQFTMDGWGVDRPAYSISWPRWRQNNVQINKKINKWDQPIDNRLSESSIHSTVFKPDQMSRQT